VASEELPNWSCEAACKWRELYSVIKVLFAISIADITRRIDDSVE
jgi:hypothetical protein